MQENAYIDTVNRTPSLEQISELRVMTDSGSIWLRNLTQSISTNKFHNIDFIDNAYDNGPYTVEIKVNNDKGKELRVEVPTELFHNVYEKGLMVSEDRLVSEFFK